MAVRARGLFSYSILELTDGKRQKRQEGDIERALTAPSRPLNTK